MFGRSTTTWSDSSSSRPTRRIAVEAAPLESRSLLSTLTITESVNPQILWPPNGRLVPVTVSGTITDSGAAVNMVQYNVQDSETGTTSGNMPVTLNSSNGQYSFVVDLQARRSGRDKAGRIYTIDILASDTAGTSASDSAVVIVPHDRGRHGGFNLGGTGTGGPAPMGGHFESGAALARQAASNLLRIGGAGQGQTNSVSVSGNGNTVTVSVTNNQTDTYNINNSFNTTVTNPPVTPPSSGNPNPPVANSGQGDHGDQGDQGDQAGQEDEGDQGGGPGNGNGHGNGNDNGNGNGNGNGHGNGHNKQGGD